MDSKWGFVAALVALAMPSLMRWFEGIPDLTRVGIGYPYTAMHLRMDGLQLGFVLSLMITAGGCMPALKRRSVALLAMGAGLVVAVHMTGGMTRHVVFPLAQFFAAALIWGLNRRLVD